MAPVNIGGILHLQHYEKQHVTCTTYKNTAMYTNLHLFLTPSFIFIWIIKGDSWTGSLSLAIYCIINP